MSEYTPTTKFVRNRWSGGWPQRAADFDRWLAGVKVEAWDEGYVACAVDDGDVVQTLNPYREEENNSCGSCAVSTPVTRIIERLTQYRENLYNDASIAAENGGDPAWDIERAEAVETCIVLIREEVK
jgi:hypothetical protein